MELFLKNNTQIREDILNLKLFFDLKEASAYAKVHLKIFRSDVDIDGFDIIIDDNDFSLIKCQLKSRFEAKTQYFKIHRIMLKPNSNNYGNFEFEGPIGCPSDSRGVILIDGKIVNKKIETRYYYLDIYLLRAMELGIFKINSNSKRFASSVLKDLRNVDLKEKIKVIHSLFFPLSDANTLLAIMGFIAEKNINLISQIIKISEIINKPGMKNSEKISQMQGPWNAIHADLESLRHEKRKIIKCELNESVFN